MRSPERSGPHGDAVVLRKDSDALLLLVLMLGAGAAAEAEVKSLDTFFGEAAASPECCERGSCCWLPWLMLRGGYELCAEGVLCPFPLALPTPPIMLETPVLLMPPDAGMLSGCLALFPDPFNLDRGFFPKSGDWLSPAPFPPAGAALPLPVWSAGLAASLLEGAEGDDVALNAATVTVMCGAVELESEADIWPRFGVLCDPLSGLGLRWCLLLSADSQAETGCAEIGRLG